MCQRNAVDLTGMFTGALDQSGAGAAEIPASPAIRPAASFLQNPLDSGSASDDAPVGIQDSDGGAVVVISFTSERASEASHTRFPGWRPIGQPPALRSRGGADGLCASAVSFCDREWIIVRRERDQREQLSR